MLNTPTIGRVAGPVAARLEELPLWGLAALTTFALGCSTPKAENASRLIPTPGPHATLADGTPVALDFIRTSDGQRLWIILPDQTRHSTAAELQAAAHADSELVHASGATRLLVDGASSWQTLSNQNNFNCHTFTLGEAAGLSPDYQLQGFVPPELGLENGVTYLLQKRFDPVSDLPLDLEKFPKQSLALVYVEAQQQWRSGDRLFFVSDLGLGPELVSYIHSGKLVVRDDDLFLISKIGAGPLCEAPLAAVLGLYARQNINYLRVYREKAIERE